jgi:hypothetical protein
MTADFFESDFRVFWVFFKRNLLKFQRFFLRNVETSDSRCSNADSYVCEGAEYDSDDRRFFGVRFSCFFTKFSENSEVFHEMWKRPIRAIQTPIHTFSRVLSTIVTTEVFLVSVFFVFFYEIGYSENSEVF